MKRADQIPAFVLGAGGYVGGEILRLLASHPTFRLEGAISESQAGMPITNVCPNLAVSFDGVSFVDGAEPIRRLSGIRRAALFGAAPHGASAAMIDRWLVAANSSGCDLRVVDTSADFRFREVASYEKIYGHTHGARERLREFQCLLPDIAPNTPRSHLAHPGCFTTAVTLAAAPLHAMGVIESHLTAFAVTGSTGSGRAPIAATHHPDRHGNFRAYQPMVHRHRPEMENLVEPFGSGRPEITFLPHSGPFARGIHATLSAQLTRPLGKVELMAFFREFYARTPFVRVVEDPPAVKDVVGSNFARIAIAVNDGHVVVFSVIDNLVKGAAGGAMQWMNRLFDLEESAGLTAPAPAWA